MTCLDRGTIAELEFETGLRETEPEISGFWCEKRRCPGLNVIDDVTFCGSRLEERCWHSQNRPEPFGPSGTL